MMGKDSLCNKDTHKKLKMKNEIKPCTFGFHNKNNSIPVPCPVLQLQATILRLNEILSGDPSYCCKCEENYQSGRKDLTFDKFGKN